MEAKKVKAIIERATDGGYGIYCPDIDQPLFGYGLSEEEAKQDLNEVLEEIIASLTEEQKPIPEALNNGDVEFEYVYDFSGFFQAYPMLNASELAVFVGVNASLMRHYKTGKKQASPEQKKRIEAGIHALAEKLGAVSF